MIREKEIWKSVVVVCCWNDQEKMVVGEAFITVKTTPFIHTPCYLDS